MKLQKNIPIDSCRNTLLAQLGQCSGNSCDNRRRYTKALEIELLAVSVYKNNGNGLTFYHLLSSGLARSKVQAQLTLKHCLKKQVIFTISNYKPQLYYPTCLKSDILKNKFKNIPIGLTELGFSNTSNSSINNASSHIYNNKNGSVCDHCIVIQPLEAYVLPLLPPAPLHIHKMQFKLGIKREYYNDIAIPANI